VVLVLNGLVSSLVALISLFVSSHMAIWQSINLCIIIIIIIIIIIL